MVSIAPDPRPAAGCRSDARRAIPAVRARVRPAVRPAAAAALLALLAACSTPGPSPSGSTGTANDVAELAMRDLLIPVAGVRAEQLRDSFTAARYRGAHEAIDIMAPRGTPVLAVEDGRIVRLTLNRAGGITVYQTDPQERYVYYYAHLDRYAPGLSEGQRVQRGDPIGAVGSTGNAPANAPHLHFAIYRWEGGSHKWPGLPINPYAVWRGSAK